MKLLFGGKCYELNASSFGVLVAQKPSNPLSLAHASRLSTASTTCPFTFRDTVTHFLATRYSHTHVSSFARGGRVSLPDKAQAGVKVDTCAGPSPLICTTYFKEKIHTQAWDSNCTSPSTLCLYFSLSIVPSDRLVHGMRKAHLPLGGKPFPPTRRTPKLCVRGAPHVRDTHLYMCSGRHASRINRDSVHVLKMPPFWCRRHLAGLSL